MFRKNKKQTISVTMLSRYWADAEEFEQYLLTKPNKHALKQGQKFHDLGKNNKILKILGYLIGIGILYVVYSFIINSTLVLK